MTNDLSGGNIPDITTAYLFAGPGTAGNGRGIAWDAAGNLWMSSSGLGSVYQYSLGRTATAVTSGNITGPTNFTLISPTEADTATVSVAAQSNPYGYPTSATNVITRTGDVSSPVIVKFTLSGTAPAGSYTTSVTNSDPIPCAGQTSTNLIITSGQRWHPAPDNDCDSHFGDKRHESIQCRFPEPGDDFHHQHRDAAVGCDPGRSKDV